MPGKIVYLLLLYTAVLIYDLPKLKRTVRRDRLVYGVLMLPILYLGFLYVTDKPWPNLDELINFFYFEPAKRIVESVKLPS